MLGEGRDLHLSAQPHQPSEESKLNDGTWVSLKIVDRPPLYRHVSTFSQQVHSVFCQEHE